MRPDASLLWVPLPPPYAGPEVASELLANAVAPRLHHALIENATLRSSNMHKGRFDLDGIRAFAHAYQRYVKAARRSRVVYLVAAASTAGCIRDAALIETAHAMGRKIVLHFRGGRYDDYFAGSSPAMRALLRRAWGLASCAIVQGARLTSLLRDAAPHVPTVVVPNGLRGKDHPPKASYATNRPRLLFVGHLTYPKGFNDLIDAFRMLRARWPTIRLACAGELPQPDRRLADFLPAERQDDYVQRRHELCAETGAFLESEGVEYAGVVSGDAKRLLFQSADIFVLPSYTEGFSLAVLEAMFHGLPVVTTHVGALPDVISDGENGFLVRPGEPQQLHDALERLLANPTLRETIGRRNAVVARARYELDIVADKLAEILNDAA
jgi:glycosyltransferase involved in cell wall biosynthesis